MSYKNALSGLDHGGGKAVIIGDPVKDKNEALLRAYGRFVESLGGRYVTAADVGTYVADMDIIAKETRFATGRSEANGGSGDSSVLTAYGVFHGMRACAAHVWGNPSLKGKTVGIAGVGKVGRLLTALLVGEGAHLVVTDIDRSAVESLRKKHPEVEVVADTASLVRSNLDVYAPCALGGALDDVTVEVLRAKVVCGAANNQLAIEGPGGTAETLMARGITYAPDFLVNAGGVIQVSDEFHGFHFSRSKEHTEGIFEATASVLRLAADQGVSPAMAADRLAERRMAQIGSNRIWLPQH
jgi:valine dehydrogenase (NAD+)